MRWRLSANGLWLSLVERLNGVQEVESSNLSSPRQIKMMGMQDVQVSNRDLSKFSESVSALVGPLSPRVFWCTCLPDSPQNLPGGAKGQPPESGGWSGWSRRNSLAEFGDPGAQPPNNAVRLPPLEADHPFATWLLSSPPTRGFAVTLFSDLDTILVSYRNSSRDHSVTRRVPRCQHDRQRPADSVRICLAGRRHGVRRESPPVATHIVKICRPTRFCYLGLNL